MDSWLTGWMNKDIHCKSILIFTDLAKAIHVTSSHSTKPDDINSSAKSSTDIPSSSCLLNCIPAWCNMSMESCAYISSLWGREMNIEEIETTDTLKRDFTDILTN